jgi:hypothetical protein
LWTEGIRSANSGKYDRDHNRQPGEAFANAFKTKDTTSFGAPKPRICIPQSSFHFMPKFVEQDKLKVVTAKPKRFEQEITRPNRFNDRSHTI